MAKGQNIDMGEKSRSFSDGARGHPDSLEPLLEGLPFGRGFLHLRNQDKRQGWTDAQVVMAFDHVGSGGRGACGGPVRIRPGSRVVLDHKACGECDAGDSIWIGRKKSAAHPTIWPQRSPEILLPPGTLLRHRPLLDLTAEKVEIRTHNNTQS